MSSVSEKPLALFDFGEHVRYVGTRDREVRAGKEGHEVVLVPGMVGVVILTAAPSISGQCRVQFKNGFQIDVTPENRADFEPTHERDDLPV
jgi:hypothetical protein